MVVVALLFAARAGAQPDEDAVVEEDQPEAVVQEGHSGSGEQGDEDQWDAESGDWDVEAEDAQGSGDGEDDSGDGDFSVSEWIENHLSWGGYYENQLMIYALPRHTSDPGGWGVDLTDYNKVRLELSASPMRGMSAQMHVVFQTYHGTTKYALEDLLPPRFDAQLDALAALDPALASYALKNEIYVDNAFISASFWKMRLRVGKQQIRFGSGYLWNPTDPFNVKDLLDPAYEKRGVTALRLQLFLPHEGLIEVYALPHEVLDDFHLQDTALAFRARVGIGRWVLAASYSYFLDLAGYDTATFTPVQSRRHLLGFSVTGEIAGVGLWAEAAYNMMRRDDWDSLTKVGRDDWFEVLGGINYTFRCGVMVMAEYLYNHRGRDRSEDYTLLDWFSWLDQTLRYMAKHYVTATVQVPVTRIHTTFSLTGIVNASDHSFIINPWITVEWTQWLSVMFYGAITWGDSRTDEFSSSGQAGYVRFRFSF